MKKWKCLIVDDEPPAVKVLETYISSLEYLEPAGICNNAFQAMDVLANNKIDLIFLDVNMPKLLGTQFLRSLDHPPRVIFITAHKDYAIEAFELYAVDYLLKPVSFERFLKAVNKFCQMNTHEPEVMAIDQGFLYFRADRKMVKVFLDHITFVESYKDYVVIHRQNEPDLKVKYTITNVENMLPRNFFVRIHRSFIVSVNKVTAFTNNDVEIGKTELPIGRSYQEVFKILTGGHSVMSDEIN
jgi:DNA-binding LytR/AlgR family response regulator